MADRVLVIGGTGMLGAPVVQALLESGRQVRLLARDRAAAQARFAAAEVFAGDVLDERSVLAALEGCGGVHVNLRGRSLAEIHTVEVEGTATVARAAAALGVGRITYLSGAGLRPDLAGDPFVAAKLAAEAAITRAATPFTIFRATHFMESLPMFVRGGRADVLGRQPHTYHYLAAADYARMVAQSFDEPAAAGRVLDVFGPEAFTMGEALSRYVEACQPGVKVGVLPLPIARAIALVRRDAGLSHAAALFASFQRIGEAGDPSPANALLGAPTTTLAQWCEGRRSAQGLRAGV